MISTGKIGLAKVEIATQQHPAALVPSGTARVLSLLRWRAEVKPPDTPGLPSAGRESASAAPASPAPEHASGGPFGAVVFGPDDKVIAAGVNRVMPHATSLAHAENMAYMLAQQRLQTPRLNAVLSPVTLQMLYDQGWLLIDMFYFITTIPMVAIGVAGLTDKRAKPLFPRWVCWYSIWAGLSFLFELLMPFFKTGLFARQGWLNFWVEFVVWFAYILLITFFMLKAIPRLQQERAQMLEQT